jgi:hypothetical protein
MTFVRQKVDLEARTIGVFIPDFRRFEMKKLGTFGRRIENSPTLQPFQISKKTQLFSLFGA